MIKLTVVLASILCITTSIYTTDKTDKKDESKELKFSSHLEAAQALYALFLDPDSDYVKLQVLQAIENNPTRPAHRFDQAYYDTAQKTALHVFAKALGSKEKAQAHITAQRKKIGAALKQLLCEASANDASLETALGNVGHPDKDNSWYFVQSHIESKNDGRKIDFTFIPYTQDNETDAPIKLTRMKIECSEDEPQSPRETCC